MKCRSSNHSMPLLFFAILVSATLLELSSPYPLPDSSIFVQQQQQQQDEECESIIPYWYDSGRTRKANVNTIVSHPSALWIQLNLTRTTLASNAKLILQSVTNAATTTTSQEINADDLIASVDGYSGVFEGDTVSVMLAYNHGILEDERRRSSGSSRIVISNINVGLA